MWPLVVVLLFAGAVPQQQAVPPQLTAQQKQQLESAQQQAKRAAKAAEGQLLHLQDNTCYTVRSYHFERQDGQAPTLTGVSTCTPANKLQQRRVSRTPGSLYVPLGLQTDNQK